MCNDIGLIQESVAGVADSLSSGDLDGFWDENTNDALLISTQTDSQNLSSQQINTNK